MALYLEHRDEKGQVSRGRFVRGVTVIGNDEPWSGDYAIEQALHAAKPSAHLALVSRKWALRVIADAA